LSAMVDRVAACCELVRDRLCFPPSL
jgi:hypothetical protein